MNGQNGPTACLALPLRIHAHIAKPKSALGPIPSADGAKPVSAESYPHHFRRPAGVGCNYKSGLAKIPMYNGAFDG